MANTAESAVTTRRIPNITTGTTSHAPRIPMYYTVKERIAELIESQGLKPGDSIPSEHELMERYGVSRITVRRAIDELANEGRLYRVQGKGTFVREDSISEDLLSLVSCTQDIRNLGMTPSRVVISAEVVKADARRRSELDLTEGDEIFRLERVYYADGTPINHTTTHLPYRYFPGIEQIDFSKYSLYEVLETTYHTNIIEALRSIQAVSATENIANYLQIDAGDPVLYFSCVTMGEVVGRKIPIESFDCHYRSNKFKFYIRQAVG